MAKNIIKVLSNKQKKILKLYSNEIYFDKEESIIKKNSALHSIYYIKKGMIKYKDDEQKLYFMVGEGDFVGLSSIYNEKKKMYNAYVSPNSTIVQIEKKIIKKILHENPKFTELIMKYIGRRVLFFTEQFSFRNKRINGALASFLLMYDKKKCLHDITRKEIGEIIGYSRENISKVLKMFIRDGIILENNKAAITIINKEKLEKIKRIG